MIITDALLLDFKRCQRRAYLNRYGDRSDRDEDRDFLLKLRQESQQHVFSVLERFYPDHHSPVSDRKFWQKGLAETLDLMAQGVDCIYQGVLAVDCDRISPAAPLTLLGYPHLLIKRPGQSRWGDWYYAPISIQLGRRPKPEYKLIATYYAYLLQQLQETLPPIAQIVLRRQNHYSVVIEEWLPRLEEILRESAQTLSETEEPEVFISRQRCSLCPWYRHCYGIAQAQGHLSLVPGVTPSRYESLQAMGVVTVESLAQACANELGEKIGQQVAIQLQQQALSLVENRALRRSHRPVNLPTAEIELYFDIEAEPERNLDYLLGVVLRDRNQPAPQFFPFLAKNIEDEEQAWLNFLEFVQSYPTAPIFHYSEYEAETIKRLGKLYQTPRRQVDQVLARLVDLHHRVTTATICPVESYSLKAIANWLGFRWRDAKASGDQCVCWYDQWLLTGDNQFLDAILRYNEDDCLATLHLKDWLVTFLETGEKE